MTDRRTVRRDDECAAFLQWALPRLRLRWAGFRKVRGQVCKRLRRRLHELGLATLDEYRGRLDDNPEEWAVLDAFCRITISRLYRDRGVFDVLGAAVLPQLAAGAALEGRPVRCWSAGCASGEEAYTLKILWDLEVAPKATAARLEVLGTDADERPLRRAAQACFAFGSLKDVPAPWRDLAFEERVRCWCVRPAHRAGVAFARQDIRSDLPPGRFDLILCRNLAFTYFETGLQRAILDRLAAVLRVGGYLVIGAHEQLPDGDAPFAPVAGCRAILRLS